MGKARFIVGDRHLIMALDLLPSDSSVISMDPHRPNYIEEALADKENWRLLPDVMIRLSQTLPDYEITVEDPNLPDIEPIPEYSWGIDLETGKWVWEEPK